MCWILFFFYVYHEIYFLSASLNVKYNIKSVKEKGIQPFVEAHKIH